MHLAFFNIPASGHVNPTLPVVAELVRRGVRVTYFCTEAYRTKIEATGATYRAYHGADDTLAPAGEGIAAPFFAMRQLLDNGARMLPWLIDQVRDLQPDAVMYDTMTPWGKQVGQVLRLPVIASCAIFIINSRNIGALPRDGAAIAQFALNLPKIAPVLLGYRQTANHIQRRFDVPSPALLDFFTNPGDMTLVYASRKFTAGADRFDDSFKFTGVNVAPRNDGIDFPLSALDGSDRRVIYISLGTIFNKQAQFFRDCIAAFGETDVRRTSAKLLPDQAGKGASHIDATVDATIVMSIGKSVQMNDLGEIPSNFIVRPSVPQLDVLQRTSVFITHGGMNSTAEAMWFGVPMVVVPQVGDQIFIGQRVAQLKAGVLLRANAATPEALRTAVSRVSADATYRANAQRLGESLRAAGGFARAADEVIAFVEKQKAQRVPHSTA